MKSINGSYTSELTIEKSKFICLLYYVDNENEVKNKLIECKDTYKGATHYCYAYIICNKEKCSDDKEPSGTAGKPLLNVLKNKGLNNILVIVVRYFGGIKLGTGGLVRAYTSSLLNCLENVPIIDKEEGIILEINVSYDNVNKLYKLIEDKYIKEKNFDEKINLVIHIPLDKYYLVKNDLNNICDIKEKESIYV